MGAQSADTAQGLCPILKSIVALEFVASDISEGNRQPTREHETESRIEREMTRQVHLTFSDGKWISPSSSLRSVAISTCFTPDQNIRVVVEVQIENGAPDARLFPLSCAHAVSHARPLLPKISSCRGQNPGASASVCVRRPCCPPDSAKCHLRRRCKKIVMSSNLFLSAFLLLSPFRYKVFPLPSRKLCTEGGGIIALAALSFKLCQNGFKDQT